MSLTSRVRAAAFHRLPKHWQPAASYYYYRARLLLDPELAVVCRALLPGTRAIDIGANEGVYTHAFAASGAQVEAFEPQPRFADVLRAYARHHRGVRVHGVALGESDGTATLHVPERDGRPVEGHARLAAVTGNAVRYPVEVRTLDSFGFTNVAVVKIDVEGHELEVVRGARETIAACRPTLLVEVEQRHLSLPMERAFEELASLGYRGQFIDPGARRIRAVEEFDAERDQPPANADVARARYVNNFIFTPLEHAHAGTVS